MLESAGPPNKKAISAIRYMCPATVSGSVTLWLTHPVRFRCWTGEGKKEGGEGGRKQGKKRARGDEKEERKRMRGVERVRGDEEEGRKRMRGVERIRRDE